MCGDFILNAPLRHYGDISQHTWETASDATCMGVRR